MAKRNASERHTGPTAPRKPRLSPKKWAAEHKRVMEEILVKEKDPIHAMEEANRHMRQRYRT